MFIATYFFIGLSLMQMFSPFMNRVLKYKHEPEELILQGVLQFATPISDT